MAINVFANVPAFVVAKQNALFSAAGLDSSNILVIFEGGNPFKSWKPDRTINSIYGFTEGKGYLIRSSVDIDLTEFIMPPMAVSAQWTTIEGTRKLVSNHESDANGYFISNVGRITRLVRDGVEWYSVATEVELDPMEKQFFHDTVNDEIVFHSDLVFAAYEGISEKILIEFYPK